MVASIEKQKEEIQRRKNLIKLKEQALKKVEQKLKTRDLIHLGNLLKRSGLDVLDKDTIIGALSELKEMSSSKENLQRWNEKSKQEFFRIENENTVNLIVSFPNTEINDEIKNTMKKYNAKFNKFRNEWYMEGIKVQVEEQFKNYQPKVEICD
jgi:hypothetical protein